MTRHIQASLAGGFTLDQLTEAVRAAVDNRLFTTVSVVAELMDLDERSVRRGIERGDLPGIRVGSAIRIPVAALFRLAAVEPEDETAPVGKTGAVALLETPDTTSDGQVHDNDLSA
jgi:excisionase family DNA binding protein